MPTSNTEGFSIRALHLWPARSQVSLYQSLQLGTQLRKHLVHVTVADVGVVMQALTRYWRKGKLAAASAAGAGRVRAHHKRVAGGGNHQRHAVVRQAVASEGQHRGGGDGVLVADQALGAAGRQANQPRWQVCQPAAGRQWSESTPGELQQTLSAASA